MIHTAKFNNRRSKKLTRVLSSLTLLACLMLLAGCGQKLSPEVQALKDMYDRIEEEMTEEQVGAIVTGHKSNISMDVRKGNGNGEFKRESAYSRNFYKSGAQEGDYLLNVFFDKDGYVVGKEIVGILK